MDSQKIGVTIEEAVEFSGIGRSKIFEAMREGKLPARKSG
jgi:predicted DNA-binding transcriptional regulator AlpA